MIPRLEAAEYVGGHTILVRFEDGVEARIDLESELWGEVFEPLKDPEVFRRFRLDEELNTLTWPSGADLAPEFLYARASGQTASPRVVMDKVADAEIEQLWWSADPVVWQRALDRYWRYIKPANLVLEHEMESLDPREIERLGEDEWFDWLRNKYFVWKYTAPNRYATTTAHLERYAQQAGKKQLLAIRDQVLAAVGDTIERALRVAGQIKGLGPSGASGLLAVLFPDKFGTIDQFLVGSLLKIKRLPQHERIVQMNPESLTVQDGVVLIGIMRGKAQALNALFGSQTWTPRKIDKVLWASERKQ